MFEAWAPLAGRLALVLGGATIPMNARARGWWSADVDAPVGADYGFLIDDDPTPLPDPRSRRQPHGVHGLSQVITHAPPPGWPGREIEGGVIYELHVGTFTPEGTLDAAIGKLDHLARLGIDFVEVMPVNAFNGDWNWGYDGVLWYAVQETYGGPDAYLRFVEACHDRGLGVIQDVVYNHLGPSGNYLPRFGPYLLDTDQNTWGDAVNLAAREVRDYIIDNALMWIRDYGVDGLRLDAVHALVDHSEVHILQELAERVEAVAQEQGRPISLIAESDLNDARLVGDRADGGWGLTAQWDDDYHHALHTIVTGESGGYYSDFGSLAALGKVMTGGFFHDGTWSSFRGRNHGVKIDRDRLATWKLVTFAQDHDQVGNRAAGDRLSPGLDRDRLAIAAVLGLASPFTPMLFMGEEWAASTPWQFFTSHPELDLGRATAEGRVAEFSRMGWDPSQVPDPQDPETFRRSKLDWSEPHGGEHSEFLELYTRLIELRHRLPGLSDPGFDTISCSWNEDDGWLRLDRPGVSVVVNLSGEARAIGCPAAGSVLLATGEARLDEEGLVLAPLTAAIIATSRG